MDPLVWAILLLVLGLALVMVEVFIPSGGILGFLSVTSIVASIVLAFYLQGPTAGFVFVVVTFVTLPLVLGLAFRWLPETPIGRRLLLQPTASGEEALPDNEQRRMLKELVGKVGRAKSLMLPSGAVVVDGHSVDAVSEGMPIEPGQAVRVIEVRGTRVVVRLVEEQPPAGADGTLSRSLEEPWVDPFEEPPA